MKYLGVDYGTKRVGLATSDEEGMMAYPLETIPASDNLANVLAGIVEREGASEIVIGESLDQDGNPNAIMTEINELVGQLSFTAGVPVHLERETFSSIEAARDMNPGKRVASPRRGAKVAKDDARAAALILQRFLDKQK